MWHRNHDSLAAVGIRVAFDIFDMCDLVGQDPEKWRRTPLQQS